MLDFTTELGERVAQRLRDEQVIWLTTVSADGTPYPRPVWFLWEGESILIFSQPEAGKVRQLAHNPHVALNFNSDAGGGDIAVLIGEAQLLKQPPASNVIEAYIEKYREGIKGIGLTPESMQQKYSVPIRVTPKRMYGF